MLTVLSLGLLKESRNVSKYYNRENFKKRVGCKGVR